MDSIQCVEKEDQGGILDFWPEPLRCGKSKVVGEYGGGKLEFIFGYVQLVMPFGHLVGWVVAYLPVELGKSSNWR